MRVWRITRRAHRRLDGEGARRYGGRWNSEGIPVVYASAALSLAALEYLVHIDISNAPDDLLAIEIEVPDATKGLEITNADLPGGWRRVPAHPRCVEIGDRWTTERRALVLSAPSAVIPEERNILVNPNHPEAGRVRAASSREFAFDPRLL